MESITPAELQERLGAGESLQLLDVREDEERTICGLADTRNVPLGELPARHGELDPSRPTVCICHHGIRSAHAAAFLASQGFERVINLSGGIDRWALEVEPEMRRY